MNQRRRALTLTALFRKFLDRRRRDGFEKFRDDFVGRRSFGLRLEVRADSLAQDGNRDVFETAKRPSVAANALPPLIKYCPARGPAPKSTGSRMKSGALGSVGRVARTNAKGDAYKNAKAAEKGKTLDFATGAD